MSPPVGDQRRVKLYELVGGSWVDRGTGFCRGDIYTDEGYLSVNSEDEPDRILLHSKIYRDTVYEKQDNTLIVWTEAKDDKSAAELALSFEESQGCALIWDFIMEVQGQQDDVNMDEFSDTSKYYSTPLEPTMANLEEVEKMISMMAHGRSLLISYIRDREYIRKLADLFEAAEDLESIQDLHRLCRIVKMIVLLGNNSFIETMLSDENLMGIMGILEYDPDFPRQKANHRQYISDQSRFRQVVPIPDSAIVNKIKQTFRLQYLKDVVLARLLDDSTFSSISSMIYFNQVDIVHYLFNCKPFVDDLFALFDYDADTKLEKKIEAVRFIHQFCAIGKNLQGDQWTQLYLVFINAGLFRVLDFALSFKDNNLVKISGLELLMSMVDHNSCLVRSYILQAERDRSGNKKDDNISISTTYSNTDCQWSITFDDEAFDTSGRPPQLKDNLINILHNDPDYGVKAQAAEIFRILVDPSIIQPGGAIMLAANANDVDNGGIEIPPRRYALVREIETETFLDWFYNNCAESFFEPLIRLSHVFIEKNGSTLSYSDVSLLVLLSDLLNYLTRAHDERARNFTVKYKVWLAVSRLLSAKQKQLNLAALRAIRQCIDTNNEFYLEYFIQYKIFGSVLELLKRTGNRNNLLNSACIEFFTTIRSASLKPELKSIIKPVINHLVLNYREILESIDYVDTFKKLIKRNQQLSHGDDDDDDSDNDSLGNYGKNLGSNNMTFVIRQGNDEEEEDDDDDGTETFPSLDNDMGNQDKNDKESSIKKSTSTTTQDAATANRWAEHTSLTREEDDYFNTSDDDDDEQDQEHQDEVNLIPPREEDEPIFSQTVKTKDRLVSYTDDDDDNNDVSASKSSELNHKSSFRDLSKHAKSQQQGESSASKRSWDQVEKGNNNSSQDENEQGSGDDGLAQKQRRKSSFSVKEQQQEGQGGKKDDIVQFHDKDTSSSSSSSKTGRFLKRKMSKFRNTTTTTTTTTTPSITTKQKESNTSGSNNNNSSAATTGGGGGGGGIFKKALFSGSKKIAINIGRNLSGTNNNNNSGTSNNGSNSEESTTDK